MLQEVVNAFTKGSENHEVELDLYNFWNKSQIPVLNITSVPLSTKEYKNTSSFELSDLGYKRYFPWFVADRNPACLDDYFNVVLDISVSG